MLEEYDNDFKCPHCDFMLNSSTGFDRKKVTDGDFTICAQCAGVCIYIVSDNKYSLRAATERDIDIAKEQGLYHEIEQLIDFIKSKDSRIIRPN
jgi:hypothetical protein